ncbi:unnamed protein product [Urochloa humidicola]
MEAEITKPAAAAEAMSSMLSLMSSGSAGAGGEFTADDLEAADQLVQLSFSGGGDDDDEEEDHQHEAFSSSSARSVNKTEAAVARGDEEAEEDSGEVDRRTKKRYRLVTELYAATRPVKAAAGGKSKRK